MSSSAKAKPVTITCHVTPGSKSESVAYSNEILEIRTRKPAREGEANKDVILTVAEVLGTAKSNLELIKGHKDRVKVVAVISGMDAAAVQAKLDQLE